MLQKEDFGPSRLGEDVESRSWRVGSHPDATRILVVEDDACFRDALGKFLSTHGLDHVKAESGEEALGRLREDTFGLMLLDITLPGMSGMEVVPQALETDPDLAIVILSGFSEASIATQCMHQGAFNYLTKPIELTDLKAAIDSALQRRHTRLEKRSIVSELKGEVVRQAKQLLEVRRSSHEITLATLMGLVTALEAKSEYLRGHSARVASFAASIANELGLPENDIEHIRLAGWLHDIGKIGIRDTVLNKRGPLSSSEYQHIKEHPTIATLILEPLSQMQEIAGYVRSHHEHWDGSGYPDGLAAEDIPIGGRIIGMAEVYEALTTTRPYQDTFTPEAAAARMREVSGTVIDPNLMDAFESVVERRQVLVFLDGETERHASVGGQQVQPEIFEPLGSRPRSVTDVSSDSQLGVGAVTLD